jgi:hypothetical protein
MNKLKIEMTDVEALKVRAQQVKTRLNPVPLDKKGKLRPTTTQAAPTNHVTIQFPDRH